MHSRPEGLFEKHCYHTHKKGMHVYAYMGIGTGLLKGIVFSFWIF